MNFVLSSSNSRIPIRIKTGAPKIFLNTLISFLLFVPGLVLADSYQCQNFPWRKEVLHGQLPNKLNYYIVGKKDAKGEKEIRARMIVHAGSIEEHSGEQGVAHMLEHLVFQRTTDYPQGLHREFDKLGWRTGREINAITQETQTQYMLRLKSDQQLENGLHIFSQIAGEAALTQENWSQEKKVVLAEFREKNISRMQEKEALRKLQYPNNQNSYARYPVIGNFDSINNATVKKLRRFYQRWYQPHNISLVIVGADDPQKTENLVQHYFSGLTNQDKAIRPNIRKHRQIHSQDRIDINAFQARGSQLSLGFRHRESFSCDQPIQRSVNFYQDRIIRTLATKQLKKNLSLTQSGSEKIIAFSKSRSLTAETNSLEFSLKKSTPSSPEKMLEILAVEITKLQVYGLDKHSALKQTEKTVKQLEIKTSAKLRPSSWEDMITAVVLGQAPEVGLTSVDTQIIQRLSQLSEKQLSNRLINTWLGSKDRYLTILGPDIDNIEEKLSANTVEQYLAKKPKKTSQTARYISKQQKTALRELPDTASSNSNASLALPTQISIEPVVYRWTLPNGDHFFWYKQNASKKFDLFSRHRAGLNTPLFPSNTVRSAVKNAMSHGPLNWPEKEWKHWRDTYHLNWGNQLTDKWLEVNVSAPIEQLEKVLSAHYHFSLNQLPFPSNNNMDTHLEDPISAAQESLRFGSEVSARSTVERKKTPIFNQPTDWVFRGSIKQENLEKLISKWLAPIKRDNTWQSSPKLQLEGVHFKSIAGEDKYRAHYYLFAYTESAYAPDEMQLKQVESMTHVALRHRLRTQLSGVYTVDTKLEYNTESQRIELEVHFICAPEDLQLLAKNAEEILKQPEKFIFTKSTQITKPENYEKRFSEKASSLLSSLDRNANSKESSPHSSFLESTPKPTNDITQLPIPFSNRAVLWVSPEK